MGMEVVHFASWKGVPIVLRNTAQTSIISLVIIAFLKLKPPSIKLEIQKSDHDRFKLQHAGVMTAHVSYPLILEWAT